MSKGKIITIVGAPRSGKSFLAKKLADHYKARLFLEGEQGDFPARIEEDIKENIRPLERVLWFRTKLANTYLEALKLKNMGHIVILDVFWMSPQMFIDALLNGFERELMWSVAHQDRQLLGYPDLTIFLKISESGIRKFIKQGGRSFDQSEDFIIKQAIPVNQMHSEFFSKQGPEMKVLIIDRSSLDFDKDVDFKSLLSQIKSNLTLN